MHVRVLFTLQGKTKVFSTNLLVEDYLSEQDIQRIIEKQLEKRINIISIEKL